MKKVYAIVAGNPLDVLAADSPRSGLPACEASWKAPIAEYKWTKCDTNM